MGVVHLGTFGVVRNFQDVKIVAEEIEKEAIKAITKKKNGVNRKRAFRDKA